MSKAKQNKATTTTKKPIILVAKLSYLFEEFKNVQLKVLQLLSLLLESDFLVVQNECEIYAVIKKFVDRARKGNLSKV